MELVKQDVYSVVQVENEVPNENGRYFVITDNEFQDGNIYLNGFLGDGEIGKTTHWLKPIKDVYVLTESEMIKLIDTAMRSNSLTAQYFLEEEI